MVITFDKEVGTVEIQQTGAVTKGLVNELLTVNFRNLFIINICKTITSKGVKKEKPRKQLYYWK